MHQARFEAKKKIPLSLMQNQQQKQTPQSHSNANSNAATNAHDVGADNDVAHKDNNTNGAGNSANHPANSSEPKKKESTNKQKDKDNTTTTTSKGRELIAGLNLDYQADAKLKGLQDILKPYIIDVKVEVSCFIF
jgi:hypothetical protein